MQSHFVLHFPNPIPETTKTGQKNIFCSCPVQYAKQCLIKIKEGFLYRQFHSSFLATIELFEYTLSDDIEINYSLEKKSIFMFMMFEGHSALYRPEQNLISESQSGTIYMGCIHTGQFTAKVSAGKSILLLLNIRAEWIKREIKRLIELKPLVDDFESGNQAIFSLPQCPIVQDLVKPLKKMLSHNGLNDDDLDLTINTTLIKLVGQYHKMLTTGNYTKDAFYAFKAKEINRFILEHYPEKIVEDIPKLAKLFKLSESTLFRISKQYFDRSIHQQVIYCRMHYALKLLHTTDYTLQQISENVGYKDVKYFSKVFKSFFQISPGLIRM